MRHSRTIGLITALCLFMASMVQGQIDENDDAGKGGGKPIGGAEISPGVRNATAEHVRSDPENTKPYVYYGHNKFSGIQDTVNKHFEHKKAEGDDIREAGHVSQISHAHAQGKMEKGHYDSMYATFKWADGELDNSVKFMDEGKNKTAAAPAADDDGADGAAR